MRYKSQMSHSNWNEKLNQLFSCFMDKRATHICEFPEFFSFAILKFFNMKKVMFDFYFVNISVGFVLYDDPLTCFYIDISIHWLISVGFFFFFNFYWHS